jgi:phage-related minor tail protein
MSLLAGAIHVNLTGNSQSLDSALERGQKGVKELGNETEKTKNKSSKNFEAMDKVAVGAMASLGVALGGLGLAGIKSAGEMQKMEVALKTSMGGSVEETEKAKKLIIDFAAQTPYALGEVQGAFVKLKNMGLDPSKEAMTAYGDTASAMGKSLNDMVEAVADAATGEFERLKEFGIRSQSEGDRVKFTFKGVTTEVGKNSEEIQTYLKKLGQTNFGGGMAEQAKTLTGTFSTFSDTIQLKLGTLATKSGAVDLLTNGMTALGGAIEKIDIDAVIKGFQDFGDWIIANQQPLTAFGILIGTVAAGFLLYNTYLGITGFVTAALVPSTGALAVSMAFLTSPITLIILGIGLLVAAGYLLITNWDTVKKVAGDTWNWISSELSKAGEKIKETFAGISRAINTKIEEAKNYIQRNVEGIQQVFGGMVKIVTSLLSGDFNGAIDGAKQVILGLGKIDLYQIGVNMIQGMINGISSMAGALWNKMTEMANSAMNAVKGILGIQSPSVVFKGFGVNTVEGFNLGIDKEMPKLESKMESMAQYVMKPMSNNTTSSISNDTYDYSVNNYTEKEKPTSVFSYLGINFLESYA